MAEISSLDQIQIQAPVEALSQQRGSGASIRTKHELRLEGTDCAVNVLGER